MCYFLAKYGRHCTLDKVHGYFLTISITDIIPHYKKCVVIAYMQNSVAVVFWRSCGLTHFSIAQQEAAVNMNDSLHVSVCKVRP